MNFQIIIYGSDQLRNKNNILIKRSVLKQLMIDCDDIQNEF